METIALILTVGNITHIVFRGLLAITAVTGLAGYILGILPLMAWRVNTAINSLPAKSCYGGETP